MSFTQQYLCELKEKARTVWWEVSAALLLALMEGIQVRMDFVPLIINRVVKAKVISYLLSDCCLSETVVLSFKVTPLILCVVPGFIAVSQHLWGWPGVRTLLPPSTGAVGLSTLALTVS